MLAFGAAASSCSGVRRGKLLEAEIAPEEGYELPTAVRAFGRGDVCGGSGFAGLTVGGDGKSGGAVTCGGLSGAEQLLGAAQTRGHVARRQQPVVADFEELVR